MKVRTQLIIDIETDFADDKENTEETLRYCFEEDLDEAKNMESYIIHSVKVKENKS